MAATRHDQGRQLTPRASLGGALCGAWLCIAPPSNAEAAEPFATDAVLVDGVAADGVAVDPRWRAVWQQAKLVEVTHEPESFGAGSERPPLELDEEAPSAEQRALAFGAALVPGLLVHGSGSFVLGRKQTALRLLLLQGVGLGLVGLGGGVIAATGAARDFVGPAAALTVVGGGLFTLSALGDFYSVLAPPGGLGVDPGWVPHFQAELGYRHIYDPQFAYRHFLVNGMHGRVGKFRLSPSVWSAPESANRRLRVELAYRFMGPTPGSARTEGSFIEAELAYTDHSFGFEDFGIRTVEGSVNTRWDLSTYDRFLAGSFLDFSLGMANQLYDFGPAATGVQSTTMLLGGFGFGVFLGDQRPMGGYVRAYYDHRHDGFAAGLLLPGLISGVLGHFGLEGVYYLTRSWGVRADVQVGSATVAGLSGLFRFGGDR